MNLTDYESTQAWSEILTPRGLSQFLAAKRWSIIEQQPGRLEVWSDPEDVSYVLIPFNQEVVDYKRRLEEAIRETANAFTLRPPDLAEQVASLRADVFFLRLDQDSTDGTIALREAAKLLQNVTKMVRAAATTTASPSHSHRGRRPANADAFMSHDLRMGHTKRGSFIVTVVARLDGNVEERQPLSAGETEISPAAPEQKQAVVIPPSSQSETVAPFARRVMVTLARSLDATRRTVAREGLRMSVGAAAEQGVSAELVQAVREIGTAEGLKGIDLSFDWAESIPEPTEIPRYAIEFNREEIELLEDVEDRLSDNHEDRLETLIGPVASLARPDIDPGDVDSGTIAIRAEVDGTVRKVWITLLGEDHDWAIRAYQNRLPLTVSGQLQRIGRWTLVNPVVDSTFLEFSLALKKQKE